MDRREIVEEKLSESGIENYLQEKGVDKNSIEEGKSSIAIPFADEREYYYDEKDHELKDVLVPVSEIKGVSRTSGYTWFDMLDYGVTGLPVNIDRQDFNLDTNNFLGVLLLLEDNDLNEVKNMYTETEGIHFNCYKNGDKEEYYQHTDGNHRVITAKNIGIHEIRASEVSVYEYNEQKHSAYKLYRKKYKELDEIVEELGLLLVSTSRGTNQIILDIDDWFEILFNFTYKENDLKHNFSRIDVMMNEVDLLLERLDKIKKNSNMYHHVYKIFPEKLRRVVKKITPSHVKDKGISHIIALEKVEELLESKKTAGRSHQK